MSRETEIQALEHEWVTSLRWRWRGIRRNYSAADVVRLRGSVQIEHTLAKNGAGKLWGSFKNLFQ